MTPAASILEPNSNPALYVVAVLTLYVDRSTIHDGSVLHRRTPGRYSATIGAQFHGPDDPLLAAVTRVIDSLRAVLSSYGIPPDECDHAIAALHDARLRSAQGQQRLSGEQRSG